MKNLVLCVLTLAILPFIGKAQESVSGINPNSVYPIHDSDIMYQKRIWRTVNLNEKQNRPFMAENKQITKFIFDAIEAGILQPYANDSLTTVMSKEEWNSNLTIDAGGGMEEVPLDGAATDSGWGDEPAVEEAAPASSSFKYTFKDTYMLEIQEDLIFDKKRSRMYYDVQSIKVILPAEKNEAGIEKNIGTIRYKDLEKLFRNMPNEAIWFNPQNSRGHLNFADAFNLRLFSSRIIKVANPDNADVYSIYDGPTKRNVMASDWLEQELMEYEHELWEF